MDLNDLNDAAAGGFVTELLRNQRRIYLFIASLLPNPSDIEDVYQQTCLALWQKRDRLAEVPDFFAWACGFARNEVLHQMRHNARKGAVHLSEPLLEQLADEFAAEAGDDDGRLVALDACLAKLQSRQRTLLERCYVGRESIKSIAAEMAISAAALTMRLQRIRHALVHCIEKTLAAGARS
jgi:RNA polymerase sigma-70 factor (ECF subfamily)